MQIAKLKNLFKVALLGEGRKIRKIPFGLFAGLKLSVDPGSETSLWLGLYEAELTPWLRKVGRQVREVDEKDT